jgi:hypothetical protein
VLTRQWSNTPPVAAAQAQGELGNRLLAITRQRGVIAYALVGSEPGPMFRDLPTTVVAPDPLLADAVKSTVAASGVASTNVARYALANLGVGFVTFDGPSSDQLVNALDATQTMVRLGNSNGVILWRVLPGGNTMAASRLRLADAQGDSLASIAVTGDHGRTDVGIAASSAARRLVVAEPNRWAEYARVTLAGRRLAAIAGAAQPTYVVPPTGGQLNITIAPAHQRWRWGQLGLLLVVLYLAAPFGGARRQGTP